MSNQRKQVFVSNLCNRPDDMLFVLVREGSACE
jgi:hypothetical protein